MKILKNRIKTTNADRRRLLGLCFIASMVAPLTAFAYVDPGSGSVIVTTVLGLIAAVGYTCRKYFYKAKRLITGKKIEESQEDE